MPHIGVLGWLGARLPGRPGQDRRKAGSSARHKVAAPPAGTAEAAIPPGEQPSGAAPEAEADAAAAGPVSKAANASPGHVFGVAAALGAARSWGFLLKAVSVHSANLAATLAARPLAPLHARLQAQLASMEAVQQACRQLGVDSLPELQDLMNCVLLSEHVYKIVDHPTDVSVSLMNGVKAQFPPQMATLRAVQWAQPHVRHRFLLGESDDALYVSFMGTKLPRDMATNANLFQEEVVLDAAMLSSGASADVAEGGAAAPGGAAAGQGRTLAAHRGFLARARSIPIVQLYQEARARNKRLVLCGHSLGGAVASLCGVRLLQHLPPNLHHTVSVYGFATPALGNDALAKTVEEAGWSSRIRNYIAPDDPIPTLLSFRRSQADRAAAQADDSSSSGGSGSNSSSSNRNNSSSSSSEVPDVQASPGSGPAREAAGATPAAAAVLQGANNIQAAPRKLAGLSGAHQRLGRIASHVGADGSHTVAEEAAAEPGLPVQVLLRAPVPGSLSRSGSAPELRSERVARERAEGDTAADVPSQDGLAATGSPDASAKPHPGPQHWLGRRLAAAAAPPLRRAGSAALAAAAPPVKAVVERAGSAARLVAVPLSAAASVPMRAAPQYMPLGRQLYIQPGAVSEAQVAAGQPPAALAAAPAPAAPRWPLRLFRLQAAGAAAATKAGSGGKDSGTSSLDDEPEDNVDVAAAASLQATLDGEEGASSAPAADGRSRRGVFYAHRMATYRSRLLGICQASLEGHLLVRSLPMLPSLPRPGDVAASELVAPPIFPLKAVATLAGAVAGTEAAKAMHGSSSGGVGGMPTAPPGGWRPLRFWARLLARAAGQQRRWQEPPVELLIRVEGRGLANVTRAWVEGISPADAGAVGEGSDAPAVPAAQSPLGATMAQVQILQQPAAQVLPPALKGRPPLPVVAQLSAFVSWLAATLGWVAVLRQLQPAGRSDYLVARVRLPAAAVRDAQRAAQSSLLTSVTDGPLLHSLHLGPRLSLRLQSDFSSQAVPLDIRMGADLSAQQAQRWPWPWRHQQTNPPPPASGQQPPVKQRANPAEPQRHQRRFRQRARKSGQDGAQQVQQLPEQAQAQGSWWWEWPRGTPAGSQ